MNINFSNWYYGVIISFDKENCINALGMRSPKRDQLIIYIAILILLLQRSLRLACSKTPFGFAYSDTKNLAFAQMIFNGKNRSLKFVYSSPTEQQRIA